MKIFLLCIQQKDIRTRWRTSSWIIEYFSIHLTWKPDCFKGIRLWISCLGSATSNTWKFWWERFLHLMLLYQFFDHSDQKGWTNWFEVIKWSPPASIAFMVVYSSWICSEKREPGCLYFIVMFMILRGFYTWNSRHSDIHDDQIRVIDTCWLNRFLAIVSRENLIIFLFQVIG